MLDLGSLMDNAASEAFAVSDDGSVVVGKALASDGYFHAFRWTLQSGMQDLGKLPGFTESQALGVSPEGTVVVGFQYPNVMNPYAFRWSVSNGMQNLGTPPGRENSILYDASANGSVLVGWSQACAVRWTASRGWEVLDSIYSHLLTYGSSLLSANAISPDGRYIVGAGINYNVVGGRGEAFLLDTQAPTSVEQGLNVEKPNYQLNQNYPNPFNPTTTISFSLPKREHVTLKVFDVLGREVATLVNEELNPGEHSVVFNAQNLTSGVYFYRLRAGSFVEQRKMVWVK
jgi:probable HAF family extracellular repeat protein